MRRKTVRLSIHGDNPSVVTVLIKDEKAFLASVSLTVAEFFKLCERIMNEVGLQHYRAHKHDKRARKYGAGRAHLLPFEDRLCAALMVLRGTKKFAVAQIFHVSMDTIGRAYEEMVSVINKCLDSPQKVYWHVTHAKEGEDLTRWMDTSKGSLDGTVINTTKPPDKDVLLEHSRRGKGVGLNTLTTIDARGKVVWVSASVPASKNDVWLYKESRNARFMSAFVKLYTDRGLVGAEKDARVNHVHGIKRRPGKELSEEERAINSWINSEKYNVEQVNAFIKMFGILDGLSWKDRKKLYTILQAICALINFRLECREEHPVYWGHKSRPHHERVKAPPKDTLDNYIGRLQSKRS